MKTPTAPGGLSAQAKKLWAAIVLGYRITDPAGLSILCEALRAWDRSELARREVDKHGCVTRDRYGQVRVNPAANVERDSRAQYLAALKLLRVDVPQVGGDE
jgi:phage terminase small subunit